MRVKERLNKRETQFKRENGYLTCGELGKWNQSIGVKCIKENEKYYILAGDKADGYIKYVVDEKIVEWAGVMSVCEADFKGRIEQEAYQQIVISAHNSHFMQTVEESTYDRNSF